MDRDYCDVPTRSLGTVALRRALAGGARAPHKEEIMPLPFTRVKQTALLAGLSFALVMSSALPLLGGQEAEAATKGKRANAPGDVHAAEVQSFSNSTQILIPESATTFPPSSITVSGFETPIADVEVTLNNVDSLSGTTGSIQDIDVLLVGPDGKTAIIMSDAGTGLATNANLTLDDQAVNQLPNNALLTSGTFQPTNLGPNPDTFTTQPPAPAVVPSGSALGVFNGTSANGTWTLYTADDTSNGETAGILNGWAMTITSRNGVPTAGGDSFQAQAGQPLTVLADGVLGNDSDPDSDLLEAILAGPPKQGVLNLQPDGGFTYTPNKKAKGTDSFTYLAQDPSGLNALATVDIQIKKAKKNKKGKGGKKGKR